MKKYISILLSVVMLFSIMIPTSAFAASTTSDLSAADMIDDNGTEYLFDPETNCQGLFNQVYKEVTFCGLLHGAYA